MIDFMETLLTAWGQERISPSVEVSLRSPLGHVDECGSGIAGSRPLSNVEVYVAQHRAVVAIEQAMRDLEGAGSSGRVLVQLAQARYCNAPKWPIKMQCWHLAISERTYRGRVDALHVELARRVPALARQLERALAVLDGERKRREHRKAVRKSVETDLRNAEKSERKRRADVLRLVEALRAERKVS
jgi:hypothetical protein